MEIEKQVNQAAYDANLREKEKIEILQSIIINHIEKNTHYKIC